MEKTASTATPKQQHKPSEARFYLKLDGIHGEARAPGYEGWIPIVSFQFGAGVGIGSWRSAQTRGRRSRSRSPPARGRKAMTEAEEEAEAVAAVGAEDIYVDETDEETFLRRVRAQAPRTSDPSVSEMTLTKFNDSSSPHLLSLMLQRRPMRRAVVEHVHENITLRFELSTVFVSSYSTSAKNTQNNSDDDDDSANDYMDYDRPQRQGLGELSLSLNFHTIDVSVVDKIRRPLALPATAFAAFNPHEMDGVPLPIELLVAIFLQLDQKSLAHAALACKRFAYAASNEQLKSFLSRSTSYNVHSNEVRSNGQVVAPVWPAEADNDNDW